MAAATVIDGKAFAAKLREKVAGVVARIKAESGITPGLAVVLVGDDPASRVYVGAKSRKAEELGFHSVQHSLPDTTSEADMLALVDQMEIQHIQIRGDSTQ